MKILAATNNKGKLKELKAMLSPYAEVVSLADAGIFEDVEETGKTFKENAAIKAEFAYKISHIPTIADDSGLAVDALNGEPGVYSARYAAINGFDGHIIDCLLEKLKGIQDRTARFKCCLCFVDENGEEHFFEGETEGSILEQRDGENGFGYDPVFFSKDLNKSFGTADPEEKDAISHRGRAIQKFLKYVEQTYGK